MSDVAVRFYQGDPDNGGTLLGDGQIPLLSPRSAASTSRVAWTPPGEGEYTLYAVIDPDDAIVESNEANNQVSRILVALPGGTDQVAPHVDNLTIDGGAGDTADLAVTLAASASDPAPSSGLASTLFIEYEYSLGAGFWVPVQNSDCGHHRQGRGRRPATRVARSLTRM